MKKMLLATICVSGLLYGCVSNYNPPPPPKGDPASNKLAQAASSVSNSLVVLEGIRKAEHPKYEKKLPNPDTFGMTRIASVDWVGPIGPLVKKIAQASNFRLRVLGTPPAIPIIVSISAKNTPLAEILRNADYQAGTKAYIVVYPKTKTIELRYGKGTDAIIHKHKRLRTKSYVK